MAEEYKILMDAGTWKLVNCLLGTNIVGLQWVFKAKKCQDR